MLFMLSAEMESDVLILPFFCMPRHLFTSISKIASIATGTDSMRLAGASLFQLQRGLHTHSLDKLRVAWLPCLLFQTLLPPTSRSPYSGPHLKPVLAFDVGTTCRLTSLLARRGGSA
jgi:hypothetical protein